MEPYLALKQHEAAGPDHPVVFFSVTENKTIDGEPPLLTNNNCWATPQGWILVRDPVTSTTFLLDPTDKKRIPLPHLPEEKLSPYCSCLLSEYPDTDAQPANSSCVVLIVETDAPVIWYCRPNEEDWTRHEYDIGTLNLPGGFPEKLVISPIAACGGKFYFNCFNSQLGVLEFCGPAPVFSSMAIHDDMDVLKGVFSKLILVESKQELYMVSLVSGYDLNVVYRFTVHKMDFLEQEWHEVDDIGDQVFLLSSWYFGASRSAEECGLDRNCLYMAYPLVKRLVIFDLGDGTAEVQDLDGAPASKQALWILPTINK